MHLADWIVREGLTQESAAQKIGCSRTALSRILPGRNGKAQRKPSWRLLPKIVKATNGEVTANDFMDAIPDPSKADAGPESVPLRPKAA